MSYYPQQQQYGNAAPPFVPNVQVLPQYNQFLIPASSLVANLAVKTAQSSQVRNWMLQILSANNWQNQDFATAVKFAIDYHMHHSVSMANQGGSAFEGDVEIALTLYTSFVVCNTTGMLDSIDPYQRAHLQSNAALYGNVVQEIRGIYESQNPYQAQQAYQRPVMGQAHTQGRPVAFGQAHVNPVASQAYSGRNTPVQTTVPRQGVVRAPASEVPVVKATPKINRVNNYGAVVINPIEKMELIEPSSPVVFEEEIDVTSIEGEVDMTGETDATREYRKQLWEKTHTHDESIYLLDAYGKEDSTMDRELHSLPYFGDRYEAIRPVKREVFEEFVKAEEAEAQKDEIVVDDVWFVEATLDELLNVTRVKALALPAEETKVHHYHGFVVTPVIGRVNLKPYFEKIRQVVTFADFSLQTKEYIKLIAGKEDGARELKDTLASITQIDRLLTGLVNHFLTEVIPVPPFDIGSVVEDGVHIVKTLNEGDSVKYLNAFMRFQRAVFETFFKHTSLEGDSFSGVVEYEHTDGVYIDQVAQSYSILYMNGMPSEFKLFEENKELVVANHYLMERLLDAATTLDSKKIVVTRQLLLFADGSRYSVVKKSLTDVYQLKRV